jgi:uncharacterized membrane protein
MGFLGAILASTVIGVIAASLRIIPAVNPVAIVLIAAAGGVFGSIADSVAGAVVQRKNVCVVCKMPSESRVHCDRPTEYRSGVTFVENNIVNVLATVAGAAVSLAVALAFI